jgi:thiamine phosphate synthase YjbQ (UPF0047 family)
MRTDRFPIVELEVDIATMLAVEHLSKFGDHVSLAHSSRTKINVQCKMISVLIGPSIIFPIARINLCQWKVIIFLE